MPIKKTHTVKPGDRISYIASDNNLTAQDIIDATPAVFTPYRNEQTDILLTAGTINQGEVLLRPGDILNIPTGEVDQLAEIQAIKADAEDDLTIFIDRKKCPLPHKFSLKTYFDACARSFNITYPHDPNIKNPSYKIDPAEFKTKGLPSMLIYIGNDPVLTGEIEVPSNAITATSSTQTLGGRSSTFLLQKSDKLPTIQTEFIDMKLDQIFKIVTGAYRLKLEIADNVDIGEAFAKAEWADSEKPYSFLSRLARERSALVSDTGNGACLLHKYTNADPVANFVINQDFIEKIGAGLKFLGIQGLEFTFDTSNIMGNYIGKTSTPDDQNITETVESKVLKQLSVKILSFQDADAVSLPNMTAWEEQKTIREFYNNIIPYPSWLNPNTGKRWRTGDTITIEVPEAYISKPVLMLVKECEYTGDTGDKRIAILKLLPIGVYE